MLLIVGLGNPGRRYAGNRHNIGFMAADEIHRRHRFSPWRARFEGEISEGTLAGEKVLLLKPATFMNESGRAVGQAMRFFKLTPDDIVVLYDELDLAPGKVRVKTGGGRPSHNGLRSITAHCGNDYRRVRVGIGHPGHKALVNSHVLKDFAKSDHDWVRAVTAAIAEHAGELAEGRDSSFMNKVHLTLVDTGLFDGAEPPEDEPPQPAKKPKPAADKAPNEPAGKPGDKPAAKPEDPHAQRHGALADGLRKLFGRKPDQKG
jgi:PTH1 family peptidyl-tRNA hydrolase